MDQTCGSLHIVDKYCQAILQTNGTVSQDLDKPNWASIARTSNYIGSLIPYVLIQRLGSHTKMFMRRVADFNVANVRLKSKYFPIGWFEFRFF